jgi:hypothetical protein
VLAGTECDFDMLRIGNLIADIISRVFITKRKDGRMFMSMYVEILIL